MSEIYLIGAGGHCKVVISLLQSLNIAITGIIDDNPAVLAEKILDIPVLGDTEYLKTVLDKNEVGAIIAIGNNKIRKKIVEKFKNTSIKWLSAVHNSAYVHNSVKLGAGSVVFAGVVIQPDAVIGNHCIVNTSAHIDHDCHIADYVHIAPGTALAGSVKVAEGAFMGIGSKAIPSSEIGQWSTVGAGATVIEKVLDNSVVVGTPARALQK